MALGADEATKSVAHLEQLSPSFKRMGFGKGPRCQLAFTAQWPGPVLIRADRTAR